MNWEWKIKELHRERVFLYLQVRTRWVVRWMMCSSGGVGQKAVSLFGVAVFFGLSVRQFVAVDLF